MSGQEPRVLFVEDEAPFRRFAGGFLEESGFRLTYAGSGAEALDVFDACRPDLVLLDLNLPDLHGLEVLRRMRRSRSDIRVIVLTSYVDAAHAVSALKAGATDYITKPVELDNLARSAQIALRAPSALGAADAAVAAQTGTDTMVMRRVQGMAVKGQSATDLVGEHPRWRQVVERLERVVESGLSTLLLLGESGTGKTALARRFHELSPCSQGPFVEINCPSIPEALLESELFGYERGAFTGATARKRGQIELADGGTLFLDEIGDLPQGLQPKLLRFLEQRTFRRVGGLENLRADVRLVCATNQDLRQAVETGTFRRDLFYRLDVVSIELPPLRERGSDVALLAESFVHSCAARLGRPAPQLTREALGVLAEHRFPGNIRELRNLIQRSVAFAKEGQPITPSDLDVGSGASIRPRQVKDGDLLQPVALEALLNAIEAHYVDLALSRSASQREAGSLLGLDRFSLARRRKPHGPPRGQGRGAETARRHASVGDRASRPSSW